MDDYTVVVENDDGVILRITSTDGRAIPHLEDFFGRLRTGGVIVTAEKRKTESVGLFIGDLHVAPAPRSFFSRIRSRFGRWGRREAVMSR